MKARTKSRPEHFGDVMKLVSFLVAEVTVRSADEGFSRPADEFTFTEVESLCRRHELFPSLKLGSPSGDSALGQLLCSHCHQWFFPPPYYDGVRFFENGKTSRGRRYLVQIYEPRKSPGFSRQAENHLARLLGLVADHVERRFTFMQLAQIAARAGLFRWWLRSGFNASVNSSLGLLLTSSSERVCRLQDGRFVRLVNNRKTGRQRRYTLLCLALIE
jgi:hypothetical protein